MCVSAGKLGILTWGGGLWDSQSTNYSVSHVRVGFTRESERLLLILLPSQNMEL